MKSPLPLAAALAVALAACTPEFDPASEVNGLRVLAIRAEPPEIAPAPAGGAAEAPDRAALTSLVLRPEWAEGAGPAVTVVHVACIPVPGDPTPSACVALASLRDPTQVLAAAAETACGAPAGGEAPPSVVFAGFEACDRAGCGPAQLSSGVALPAAELELPVGYGFDALPAGAPERILGVQAIVLAFAVEATPDELAAGLSGACPEAELAARLSGLWASRPHVLATKRVQIRGPEAPDAPNRNPSLDGIAAGGAALAPDAPTALPAGTHALSPVLPGDAEALHQAYTKLDAAGAPLEPAVEEWVYSWFATAGELEELHTRGAGPQEWRVGPSGGALVAAVVRDLRGGVAWVVREVSVTAP